MAKAAVDVRVHLIPHRCPVCGGRGTMTADFYEPELWAATCSSAAPTVQCRACQGSGLVWPPPRAK